MVEKKCGLYCTPKGHEDGEEHGSRIIKQISELWKNAGSTESLVVADSIAERTQSNVSWNDDSKKTEDCSTKLTKQIRLQKVKYDGITCYIWVAYFLAGNIVTALHASYTIHET